ncbi:MAG: helix-turn-helix domain-containing protein [Pseudomonadota bacterium]
MAILSAAYETFAAYGFRKTSMAEIASATGISRPALYLEFENKTDIFRALSRSMIATALQNSAAVLKEEVPFDDRLQRAISVGLLEKHRVVSKTRHGQELLDLHADIAGDLFEDWIAGMKLQLIEAFTHNPPATGLSAEETATLMLDMILGMKYRSLSADEMEARLPQIVKLING